MCAVASLPRRKVAATVLHTGREMPVHVPVHTVCHEQYCGSSDREKVHAKTPSAAPARSTVCPPLALLCAVHDASETRATTGRVHAGERSVARGAAVLRMS